LLALPGVGRGVTLVFVIFAWVMFRAENLDCALGVWRAMVGLDGGWAWSVPVYQAAWLPPCLLIALSMPNCQQLMGNFKSLFEYYSPPSISRLSFRPSPFWGAALAVCMFGCVLLLSKNTKFLYFDF